MPSPFAIADESLSPRQRRFERVVLLVLASVQFTAMVDFVVIMPLGPTLKESLHISPAQFGLIVSSYTFAAGFAGLVTSSIVDRFDRRTAFITMFAGFLLGTLFCAAAPSYSYLVAARIATGACGGVLGGMAQAIVGDVFPDSRRGRATASLTSAFSLASVVGVPFGLWLGATYDWHLPFLALVVAGLPVFFIAMAALPPMRGHLGGRHTHPLRQIVETFSIPNHQKAFALMAVLMIGSFAVIPYIGEYLVRNVGLSDDKELPLVYVVGGALTLISSPIVGRLADRHGKLFMFRIIAPLSALMLIAITHLPPAHIVIAIAAVGALMVCNTGRMIAAMAMITGSVEPRLRGGFMSANASVMHIACGIGSYIAGLIIVQRSETSPLENYGLVGWIGCAITLVSVWLAGRVRIIDVSAPSAEATSLAAAAEATADIGGPLLREACENDSTLRRELTPQPTAIP
jgi:DHA1 family inner membrane transport protein